MTTTDLSLFGYREKKMTAELLLAMCEYGLPGDFEDNEVTVMMNQNSGSVFLTNSEYQVVMLANDNTLYSFYTSPYEGKEGSFEDLLDEYNDMCHEDQEWFQDIAKNIGRQSEIPEAV